MYCEHILNDRKFLAGKVGELMRKVNLLTGGNGSGLSPNKAGKICCNRDEEDFNFVEEDRARAINRAELKEKYGADYYCFATPDWLRKTITREYGYPALDVASSHDMQFGKRFYTPKQDGMKQNWYLASKGGIVFGNPPFISSLRVPIPNGHLIGEWVEKAYKTSQQGREVLFLLPVWRKYEWFPFVVEHAEVRFSAVPVVFEGFGPMAGRTSGNTNWYSECESILAIFRKNQKGFLGEWLKP